MNKLSAITRVLIASTILLLIIGSVLLLLPSARLRILEATYNRGGAGACGTIPLYDRQGRLHEIPLKAEQQPDVPLYYGEAPLYSMGDKATDPNKPADSCIYLDSFTPEEVAQGVAVYPLVLDRTLVSQIGVGESTSLKVTATVQDKFSGLDYSSQYLVYLEPGEEMKFAFTLDAPQFKYNQVPQTVTFTPGEPTELTWIIAPQDTALGQQWIGVIIDKYPLDPAVRAGGLYDYQISLEVRPTNGVDPRLLSKLSLWGSLFMGCLTVVKTIYDMLPKASFQKESKSKPKPKKRKID